MRDETHFWTYAWIVGMSVWGGAVSYVRRLRAGHKYAFWRLVGDLVVSAFAGWCTGLLLIALDWSQTWVVVCSGIAGHMGGRIIDVFEASLSGGIQAAFNKKAGE